MTTRNGINLPYSVNLREEEFNKVAQGIGAMT
jgi:hypothetical protein